MQNSIHAQGLVSPLPRGINGEPIIIRNYYNIFHASKDTLWMNINLECHYSIYGAPLDDGGKQLNRSHAHVFKMFVTINIIIYNYSLEMVNNMKKQIGI